MAKPPQKIPIVPSPAITSYSYADFADGTGRKLFYGFEIDDGDGTQTYGLTDNTGQYSDEVSRSGTLIASGNAESFNYDFDLQAFNTPKNIKGDIYVTVPWGFKLGVAGLASGTVIVRACKWDGTTETQLASGCATAQSHTDTTGRYYLSTIKLPITTLQHFKRGDVFRINVIGEIIDDIGAQNSKLSMAFSPTNNNGETVYQVGTDIDTTRMLVNVPFRLDV